MSRVGLGLLLAVLSVGPAGANDSGGAGEPLIQLAGDVVDPLGRPVAQIEVFAVFAGGSRVTAAVATGRDGRFALSVPRRAHDLGVLSPVWGLRRVEERGPNLARLHVTPVFFKGALAEALATPQVTTGVVVRPLDAPDAVSFEGPTVGKVTGRIVDETGAPLPGVRVLAVNPRTGNPVTATVTDKEGNYRLVAPAGGLQLRVASAGLMLVRVERRTEGRLDFVLTVDAAPEAVTIYTGEVLRFRMSDSIWPEYHPPPEARAKLLLDYGIATPPRCSTGRTVVLPSSAAPRYASGVDGQHEMSRRGTLWDPDRDHVPLGPGSSQIFEYTYECPLSVAYRGFPKYWWLRVLESTPPNPAVVAQVRGWEVDQVPRRRRVD